MLKIIINFLVSWLLVFLASKYFLTDWIILKDWYTSALIFSFILAFINATLWTILRILWIPLNFLTLGLFGFLITLLLIWITDSIYSWIEVKWFLAYMFIAFLPAITWAIVSQIKKS